MNEPTSPYLRQPLRKYDGADADPHLDACLNFATLLEAAKDAFRSRDYQAAVSRLRAAAAVIERVAKRPR